MGKTPGFSDSFMDFANKVLEEEINLDNNNQNVRRALDMLDRNLPKWKRVMPDKHGCEVRFSWHFVNEEMDEDFPLIARDFLKHEAANLEQYRDLSYGEDMPQYSSLPECWKFTMVHAMHMGFKQGSAYCRELLKYLFRIYYPKIYKYFKRFHVMSRDEVLSLADVDNKGHFETNLVPIILVMADVYEIELDVSCDVLYLVEEDACKTLCSRSEVDFFDFDEGMRDECFQQIKEIFTDNWQALARKKTSMDKFTKKALEYCGYPGSFLEDGRDQVQERVYARTLALLKSVYPNREFSAQEIMLYSNLFDVILILTDISDVCYDTMMDVLGLGDDTFNDKDDVRFDPEKIVLLKDAAPKKPVLQPLRVESAGKKEDEEYPRELLLELDEMRHRVREREEENRQLRSRLKEANRQLAELNKVCGELEQGRQELAALRSHLYHSTEYDEAVPEEGRNEIIQKLRGKKIVIVGGHTNWVQKLRKLFSDWIFISPSVSVSNTGQYLENVEFVYFFTDTLSHSVYGMFIQMVRERHIPFGYIHGVNIDANLRQMREEIL